MRHTEHQLQSIMRELAAYLSNQEMQQNVWEDICLLEEELHRFTREAYEYQENGDDVELSVIEDDDDFEKVSNTFYDLFDGEDEE